MSSQTYNWRRFWCPREGLLNLDDNGYLSDPESRYSQILNTSVVPFESLANYPCLVLLGEPGIGKSTALAHHQTIIEQQFTNTENVVYPLNLGAYQTDIRLCQAIFESPKFRDWRQGSHHLHLFLDSLDECLFRIDAVATLLIEEFQKYRDSVDRLWLRIACRTADWPLSLEQGLQQIWGEDNARIVELAPLRRQDVIEAVQASDISPTAFLTEVERVQAVPFAIKPVTLNILINLYRKDGQLPNTQIDLYKHGCRSLCEESNQSRRDARLKGQFTDEDRLNTAAHIAAVTMFAQRYAVWTDVDHGNVPEEDVTIPTLLTRDGDGTEAKSESIIRETLSTGLFSSRGPYRLGWAHQTYAEFLAAQCLVQHKMPPSQIMALITSPYDGQIVPQLHETAAWLASMDPDIFHTIMEIDPKVLLRSDVATADMKDRVTLVENLLALFDAQQLLDRGLDIRHRYHKLAHLGLADQLRPYIQGTSKGWLVRRVAIDIAEACELRELQTDLATVALAITQFYPTRIEAAHAVVRIGGEQTKAQLRPLVFGEAGDDPDDELKGHGLFATWPTSLEAEELFTSLSTPKQENFFGMYKYFLLGDFTHHLQLKDLPSALRWVEKLPHLHTCHARQRASDNILIKAWEYLEQPGVVDLFAKVALKRLQNRSPIVSESNPPNNHDPGHPSLRDTMREDYQKRRLLIFAILPLMALVEQDVNVLARYVARIVLPEDFTWLIEQYQSSEEESLRANLIALIAHTFNWQETTHLEAAYKAYQHQVPLPIQIQEIIEGIQLDSLEAEQMRKDYQISIEREELESQRRLSLEPPSTHIQKLLEQNEVGSLETWWQLNWWMLHESDGTCSGNELDPDLTTLPGWTETDEQTRQRIVEAAKRYVLQHQLQPGEWINTNTFFRPDFAGYRGLRLLFQLTPDSISKMPIEVWKRWMPIIVRYPIFIGVGQEQLDNQLMQLAYQYAPEDFIEHVLQKIVYADRADQSLAIMQRIEHCWDDRLAATLLGKLQENTLSINGMATVLEQLLIHQVDKARMFAEQFVTVPVPQERESRERAIIVARMLITGTDDAGWPIIWPALQQDSAFGREVIADVVTHAHGLAERVGASLTAEQLANLYLWLVQQYPFAEDHIVAGATFVDTREQITWWREGLLQRMQLMGTQESVTALQRIVETFPEEDRFKWALLDAREQARQQLWLAPSPETVLQLISDRQRRLVQNSDQLLAVIRESLERLEHKLHGETPAVVDLWNITGSRKNKEYTPKDENALSDYIKRHLEDDLRERGVIANREVEIRRSEQNAKGELTDIHVQATISTAHNNVYDTITVIIEVKGCWNRELAQAMETQLVDRYLKDNQCRHGLYLIGWFNCDQWSPQDRRKQAAPKLDITEAKAQYNQQADGLSTDKVKVEAYVLNTAVR